MSGIHVSVDLGQVKAHIDDLALRQVPYIASLAINESANQVVKAEQETMEQVFDRPTPWTVNSLMVSPSNKSQGNVLSAEVRFREFAGKGTPAWKYLNPEIHGGFRRHKSHELRLISAGIMKSSEFAVPGEGVTLDAYGNMPAQQITAILAQVQANFDPTANQTGRSKARHKAHGDAIYFVRRQRGAPAGIYQRGAGRRIIPVIIFARIPSYAERFPIYTRAAEVVNMTVVPNFWRLWEENKAGFR